jgi:hypothetical protein
MEYPMSNTTYNGHKNWNYRNVSLWINNDEGLYSMARAITRAYRHKGKLPAAMAMLQELQDAGITKTPDGAPYSASSIRAAMVEM